MYFKLPFDLLLEIANKSGSWTGGLPGLFQKKKQAIKAFLSAAPREFYLKKAH